MDSLQSSVSTTSEEIAVNDSSTAFEEIVVSDDVSAKYAEEIVAYEHGDESVAIKSKFFDYFNFFYNPFVSVNKLCYLDCISSEYVIKML